ncbi:hypothetical protein H9P43_007130 [Blastocladiella emersonii ATCC 22665]|nr:hypothetical protein H9P43_007130 [Blastocladiella emersonii ATCC 22665]
MPQSIVIQVGQCGNQIGGRFWEKALQEHSHYNAKGVYDESMSTFFRNVEIRGKRRRMLPVGDGTDPIQGLEARGIMVDMEEGVINAFQHDAPLLNELFAQPHQRITSQSGSGNNWAVGHHHYGPAFREVLGEAIRREAEACDALQSVFLVHSLGGGTGSGLGTYISGMLADELLPDVYQFATVVAPSPRNDDVVTSPYNAVLALRHLAEHADAVLPVENQALLDICALHGARGSPEKAKDTGKPFDAMNDLVAQLLLNLTSSMRFEGALNVDINEITMNLVPFPQLKYLLSSLTPVTLPRASATAAAANQPRSLDHMFTAAFSRDSQLIACDPKTSRYLACALMVRGADVQVTDVRRNIDRVQRQLKFAWWNQEGWKTGLCRVPPIGQPYSLLTLANNTCIAHSFAGLKVRFMKLYKRKANVHHYTQHMDPAEFKDALESLNATIAEYRRADSDEGPVVDDWEAWARGLTANRINGSLQ